MSRALPLSQLPALEREVFHARSQEGPKALEGVRREAEGHRLKLQAVEVRGLRSWRCLLRRRELQADRATWGRSRSTPSRSKTYVLTRSTVRILLVCFQELLQEENLG